MDHWYIDLSWDHVSVWPGVIPDLRTDHSTNTVISSAPEMWKKNEAVKSWIMVVWLSIQ